MWTYVGVLAWVLLATAAPPPLTDAQRTQLTAAADRSPRLDEGAWYPLLENALAWTPGDEAGAIMPDHAALTANPAAHRGELFLIEGVLARSRPFGLSRSGPWGRTLTEWVILLERQAGPDGDRVAVVYLVDPEDRLPSPREGARVRTVARFYKLWQDRDAAGAPETYLTFVGHWGRVVDTQPSAPGASTATWLVVPLGLAALVAYAALRRFTRKPRLAMPRPRAARRQANPATESLPADPAAALDALRRRNEP